MLGLGNSIVSSSPVEKLIGTYTSDFTGGGGDNSSSWIQGTDANIFETAEGTITFTTNSSIGGSSGWLKCEMDTNQTGLSSIGILTTGVAYPVGTRVELSMKAYLPDDSNKWGTNEPISILFSFTGGTAISVSYFDLDQVIELDNSSMNNSSGLTVVWGGNGLGTTLPVADDANFFEISFGSLPNDLPQAGAIWYMKDVVINYYTI